VLRFRISVLVLGLDLLLKWEACCWPLRSFLPADASHGWSLTELPA
jgi:hypothetical protein